MENKYDNKNIKKMVLLVILPVMLGQFINVLYTIVDRIYIGSIPEIGEICLGSIGVCAPITTILLSFSYLLGIGTSTLMMYAKGRGDDFLSKKILSNGFLGLIISSIFSIGITYIFLRPLLNLCGTTEAMMGYSLIYMKIYLIGSVFYIIGVGINLIIVSMGNTKFAMFTMILGALLNILLDYIFIFLLNLNIKGAAIATAISQIVVSLCNFIFILSNKPIIKLRFNNYSFKIIFNILKRGFISFIIFATDSIAIISINASIKHYARDTELYLAIFTIVTTVYQLVTMPLLGISGGSQGLISYTYGKSDGLRLKKIFKTCFLYAVIWTSICFIIFMLIPKQMASIFSDSKNTITLSAKYIRIYMISLIPLAIEYVVVDGFTALGKVIKSGVLSLTRKSIVVICAWVMPIIIGVTGIFLSEVIAAVLSSIIALIVYLISFPKIINEI